MKRIVRLTRSPSLAVLTSLLLGGIASAAEDRECFASCKDESGAAECRFDAHEARGLCMEENGCGELRYAYADACFFEGRDEALCDEARALFQACAEPCRDEFHDRMELCRDALASCVEAVCGIELPERPEGPPLRRRLER